MDIAEIAAGRRVRIYGNLPYYITSPILHHLFAFAPIIDEIHIVIQLEVAERLAAEPGTRDYGYLSVATRLYSRPEIVLEIPREAFDPPPEVDSALVTLRLPGRDASLGDTDKERLLEFVKVCFAQKRKTLVNNLKTLGEGGARARGAGESVGLRPDARAEQLNVAEFVGLWRELRWRNWRMTCWSSAGLGALNLNPAIWEAIAGTRRGPRFAMAWDSSKPAPYKNAGSGTQSGLFGVGGDQAVGVVGHDAGDASFDQRRM